MAKTYYTDYVNHLMWTYVNHDGLDKPLGVRQQRAVEKALMGLTKAEKHAILEIYKRRDTFEDNVYQVSKKYNIHQNKLWMMLNYVSKNIAKELGLIYE